MESAVTGVIGRMRRRTRDGDRPSTDLAAAVHDRIGFWTELAREQGRELQVSIDHAPAAVALEKDEVETLVDELLTNVFAHTADTTACRVVVEFPQPDRVRLVVEDDGPGFARELVGRGESQAESSGLGLDIVSRMAEGAGGSFDVTRGRGGGARVEVVLRVSR
ncbi:MAG: HAMP domain-containing histidine kinase [Chloroflexi bacterium]|nr:MAG: HAMP domain-containing histidine kinase [Chloroflexota bacterium]